MRRGEKRRPAASSSVELPRDLVPHPRYGRAIRPSGITVAESDVRSSYFGYRDATIFASTAILADLKRQNFSTMPRGFYVDMLKCCRRCASPFLFYAEEQRHWYEELGFYVDSDCVHCVPCRRSEQELKRRFRRYSQTVGEAKLDDVALVALIEDAVYLFAAGILRDSQQLRRIRNLAKRRLPASRATRRIDAIVARGRGEGPAK